MNTKVGEKTKGTGCEAKHYRYLQIKSGSFTAENARLMRAEGDTNTNAENQELICSNCKTPMQNGCRFKDKTVPGTLSDATGNDQKLRKSFNEGTNIATDHQTHSSSAEDVRPPFASSSVCIQQLHSRVNLFLPFKILFFLSGMQRQGITRSSP